MFTKILAITAFSLSLAGAASAQDSGNSDMSGGGGGSQSESIQEQLPENWKTGGVDAMFFSDSTAGTLRSDAEISTAYGSMTAEQQAMVKADCEKGMAGGERYGASGTSATDAGNEPGSMTKLCTMIGSM